MDVTKRDKLFACIMATSFVLDDLRLLLDTHPTDQAALEYWEKYERVRNEAVKEYTKCYGPINMYDVDVNNYWTWVNEPWPWEGRC
ncbi:spore coat protein CotJB [Mobilitalea sibirica]|uniref:Spore coat protein CotJB n=1 Tax=Mobilitalea sibirica TaxID=1462919 RepID=A0A8J7H3R6_9FIRM|nr:spore coat protein CotJB [Mobilitalea sibirica]MBH1941685.1 spore coat protein CotJB [Mobilitalea sibirica]